MFVAIKDGDGDKDGDQGGDENRDRDRDGTVMRKDV